jgi:hypothetical protein
MHDQNIINSSIEQALACKFSRLFVISGFISAVDVKDLGIEICSGNTI